MRIAFAVLACVLSGCASAVNAHDGRVSGVHDLSGVSASAAPMRNGSSGAPTLGVAISGTVTNRGKDILRCTPAEFLIVDAHGDATAPISEFCDVPAIQPGESAGFHARFALAPQAGLQLRFEHGDGSYETMALPPLAE